MKTITILSVLLISAAGLAAQTPLVANPTFETPSVGGCPKYQYQPSGATWTFVGSAGITAAGCSGAGFNAPPTPPGGGSQVGFIQSGGALGGLVPTGTGPGTLSQTVSGFVAGHTYEITFYAAGRPAGAGCGDNCTELNFSVFVGPTDVLDVTNPPTSAFQQYKTDAFTATGSATISFSGSAPAGSDKTSFIDLVSILDLAQSAGGTPPQFTISTVAGNGTAGYSGDGGPALDAAMNDPRGVAVDAAGNVYIADLSNNRVRKLAPDGTITTVAGNGSQGFSGDGGPAAAAALNQPGRVAVDAAGNLYIADGGNNRARKVTTGGTITTVAGNGSSGYSGEGGPAIDAGIGSLGDVEPDTAGNLVITSGFFIFKVDTNGIITTVAGNGTQGYSGDGGPATAASLGGAVCTEPDQAGNLLISDQGNNRIRKVANGIITTVAGDGGQGYAGDGGPAVGAELHPACTSLDSAGNLYIADSTNNRIRALLANGTIWTVAGDGSAGYSGDGGPATDAALNSPRAPAVAPSGAVYFADYSNNTIRLLMPALQTPSISAGGVVSASAFGEFTSVSPGSWIEIYGSNLAVDTRSWAGSDFTGIDAPTSLDGTSVTIGGQTAFIDYISPGQVNALVPSDVATGTQPMTVTVGSATTATYNITVNPVQPGLDAPPSFKIGGTQFVVALFADGTYVLPENAIPGLNSRPAQPGDEIVLYGVGFGPVTPNIPAGQLVQQANTLASPFSMSIDGVPVTNMPYSGLAPSYTGLYQFNIVVPASTGSGAVPLTFTVDGVAGTQTLYLAVSN
jgi:uncharacterized protein (TIGR03437 family)